MLGAVAVPKRRHVALLAVVVLTASAALGCSDSAEDETAGFEAGAHEHPGPPPATETLSWDTEDRKAAVQAGVELMELFARPAVSAQEWWADLEPHLSTQAQSDYSYTDPARVPASEVTGPGSLVELGDPSTVIVHVPTDAGLYAVTLVRSLDAPAWVADRITPPEDNPDQH